MLKKALRILETAKLACGGALIASVLSGAVGLTTSLGHSPLRDWTCAGVAFAVAYVAVWRSKAEKA